MAHLCQHPSPCSGTGVGVGGGDTLGCGHAEAPVGRSAVFTLMTQRALESHRDLGCDLGPSVCRWNAEGDFWQELTGVGGPCSGGTA